MHRLAIGVIAGRGAWRERLRKRLIERAARHAQRRQQSLLHKVGERFAADVHGELLRDRGAAAGVFRLAAGHGDDANGSLFAGGVPSSTWTSVGSGASRS